MKISNAVTGALAAGCIAGGAAGVYFAIGGSPAPLPDTPTVAVDAVGAAPSTRVADSHPAPRLSQAAAVAEQHTAPERPAHARAQTPAPASSVDAETPSDAADPSPARAMTGTSVSPAVVPEPAETTGLTDPPFTELAIPADSVLGLQVETALTSEHAEVEDEIVARVTRDVRVGERVAIPAGSQAHGEVTLVERGGRLRERARLGVRFTALVLPDGTRVPIETETVFREGETPAGRSTAKIDGGAIGGAIVGGILGGTRGAVIGGSVGAGAGTATALAGGRRPATLPSGTAITVRLTSPAYVILEN